jgi:predicted O-methyltransferase YrrM
MADRLRRAARYAANPRWGLAYWRSRRARMAGDRDREFRRSEHPDLVREDAADALAELLALPAESCRSALSAAYLARPVGDDPAPWWPREGLARLVSAAASLTEARTVVEVGVARGYTSAALLAAIGPTGGHLHSIDLPPLDEDAPGFVGAVIPDRLRPAWSLHLGPSSSALPRVLRELGAIDMFVHDGDHSYASQREDLTHSWPHLRRGSLAVVDDVWSTAALDFARNASVPALVIYAPGEPDGIALLRKPA